MEELKAKLAEAEKNYAEATAKMKEMETEIANAKAAGVELTKRAEGAEAKLAEYAEAEVSRNVEAAVNKLIDDAKLAPAKKDYAVALLKNLKTTGEKKYKFADKEYSLEQIALELLDGGKVELNTEESSEIGERQAADLDGKAKDYMAKHEGVSYKDALRAVAPTGK